VDDASLHRVKRAPEDFAAGEQRARRHVSPGKSLRERHQVRFYSPVLECQEAPSAAQAGLHLVDDQKGPRLVAEFKRPREVVIWSEIDALALDRLQDQGRYVAAGQLPLECVQIAKGHLIAVRQQWP